MQQVIISVSAPIASSQSGSGSILFHDIVTGTPLASFKQSTAAQNCTALINTRTSQGGLILAVQRDKALLNVYSFQKVPFHIYDLSSSVPLTFSVLRTKYPSKSSFRSDFLV